ncbi:MAG: methionine gamma-lyase family protein [Andreesenia angusta]|nr:methionine gamma-lyase family protein [Andreesenia angusta]
MLNISYNLLANEYDLDKRVIKYVLDKEMELKSKFNNIDEIKEYNQYKVIKAMQDNNLNSTHFTWTTGYGYDDMGRDKVEQIYSQIFKTEDALVRPTIASGTHAINLTLSGLLKPGDELVYITGAPYDTLKKSIGLEGDMKGTLLEFGIKYKELPLKDKKIDLDNIKNYITKDTKMVGLQRSTGYSNRNAFTIKELSDAIDIVKEIDQNIICFVDNCYGEFIEEYEPSEFNADIMAGSLIKNPGGGLALSGGYIVGRSDLIEYVSNRATAPGIGKDCGLTFGMTRNVLQGLFLAPHIVSEAIKGSILLASVYSSLGFETVPKLNDKRSDIIQAIKFDDPEKLIKFCEGIQSASPVDSYFAPVPSEMPGYEEEVIMAAGAFIQGSSIELSADGPMREPYFAYYQGGLTYEHCKLGIMKSLDNLLKYNMVQIL